MNIRFKAIVPKRKILNAALVEDRLTEVVNQTVSDIERDFKATVRTWKHQPRFSKQGAQKRGDTIAGSVGTNDKIYEYVTKGTRAHIIRVRRARLLRFRTGYRAKTSRRNIGSRAGGASGRWVPPPALTQVHHPGTEAREFEEAIVEKEQPKFSVRCRRAIAGAIK